MDRQLKQIRLARHYGFCMGVKRAIQIAEEAGHTKTKPVNVINEIVHNDYVVGKLKDEGVGSVPTVGEAPAGTVIVSAHGAPTALFDEARSRGLDVIDATCPLVVRIHKIVQKLVANGYHILHHGDMHHDETRGVVGHAPDGAVTVIRNMDELQAFTPTGKKLALTTQTTAKVAGFEELAEEARRRFPEIEVFNTICNATTQRQSAVLDLAPEVDLMLVVGSTTSANSKRLRSISEAICGSAYLINSAAEIEGSWLDGIRVIGITAGASTPDFLVEEVIDRLLEFSDGTAEVERPKRKSRLAEMREFAAEHAEETP
jgi:4-hydroxy-3-methylbut-2-enyl diphosphate reductase